MNVVFRIVEAGPVIRAIAAIVLVNVVLTVLVAGSERRVDVRDPLELGLTLSAGIVLVADVAILALGSSYFSRYSLFVLVLLIATYQVSRPRDRVEAVGRAGAAWVALAVIARFLWRAWCAAKGEVPEATDPAGLREE